VDLITDSIIKCKDICIIQGTLLFYSNLIWHFCTVIPIDFARNANIMCTVHEYTLETPLHSVLFLYLGFFNFTGQNEHVLDNFTLTSD